MKAAGIHVTQRRRSTNMASDERTGARVNATFKLAIGPKIQVIGARSTPMANTLVLANRLTPTG